MCTLNSECGYLLHFLPHGEDGLPHIGIGHLIYVHCLDDLTDARHPNGIGQPVQCVDAANAEEQIAPLARKLVIRPCAGLCARRVSA